MPTITTLFSMILEGLATEIRPKKKKLKSVRIGKEDIKLSPFADNTTLYVENPKDTTKNISKTKWSRKYHKAVNQLYFNKTLKNKKKERI